MVSPVSVLSSDVDSLRIIANTSPISNPWLKRDNRAVPTAGSSIYDENSSLYTIHKDVANYANEIRLTCPRQTPYTILVFIGVLASNYLVDNVYYNCNSWFPM
jgi:hypothetical protein